MHGGLASKLELTSVPMEATRTSQGQVFDFFFAKIRSRTEKKYLEAYFVHTDCVCVDEKFLQERVEPSHKARKFRVSSRGT